MITPVQLNLNNAQSFGSLNVERIRVPRKSNADVNFQGNPVLGGAKKASGLFQKAVTSVKNGINNVIHSKFVENAKKNVQKFFKGVVNFVKSIPEKISNAFKNLKNKKA